MPPTPENVRYQERNYDPNKAGNTRRDFLGVLDLSNSVTKREVKTQFRRMARIYHPDNYDPMKTSMTKAELEGHFKILNNAYKYLKKCVVRQRSTHVYSSTGSIF